MDPYEALHKIAAVSKFESSSLQDSFIKFLSETDSSLPLSKTLVAAPEGLFFVGLPCTGKQWHV